MFPSRPATLEDIAPFFIAMGESFGPSGRHSKKEAILQQYLECLNRTCSEVWHAMHKGRVHLRISCSQFQTHISTRVLHSNYGSTTTLFGASQWKWCHGSQSTYPYAPSSRMDMKRWNIGYDTKIWQICLYRDLSSAFEGFASRESGDYLDAREPSNSIATLLHTMLSSKSFSGIKCEAKWKSTKSSL